MKVLSLFLCVAVLCANIVSCKDQHRVTKGFITPVFKKEIKLPIDVPAPSDYLTLLVQLYSKKIILPLRLHKPFANSKRPNIERLSIGLSASFNLQRESLLID